MNNKNRTAPVNHHILAHLCHDVVVLNNVPTAYILFVIIPLAASSSDVFSFHEGTALERAIMSERNKHAATSISAFPSTTLKLVTFKSHVILTYALSVGFTPTQFVVVHTTVTDVVRLNHGIRDPILYPQAFFGGIPQTHVLDDDACDRCVLSVHLFRIRRAYHKRTRTSVSLGLRRAMLTFVTDGRFHPLHRLFTFDEQQMVSVLVIIDLPIDREILHNVKQNMNTLSERTDSLVTCFDLEDFEPTNALSSERQCLNGSYLDDVPAVADINHPRVPSSLKNDLISGGTRCPTDGNGFILSPGNL